MSTIVRTRNTHTGALTKSLFVNYEDAQAYALTAGKIAHTTVTITQVIVRGEAL